MTRPIRGRASAAWRHATSFLPGHPADRRMIGFTIRHMGIRGCGRSVSPGVRGGSSSSAPESARPRAGGIRRVGGAGSDAASSMPSGTGQVASSGFPCARSLRIFGQARLSRQAVRRRKKDRQRTTGRIPLSELLRASAEGICPVAGSVVRASSRSRKRPFSAGIAHCHAKRRRRQAVCRGRAARSSRAGGRGQTTQFGPDDILSSRDYMQPRFGLRLPNFIWAAFGIRFRLGKSAAAAAGKCDFRRTRPCRRSEKGLLPVSPLVKYRAFATMSEYSRGRSHFGAASLENFS